jgi:uncharacterized protein (DUF2236 family)
MQRVAREGILIAGGGRAILLQIAHPGVGRGVAEHSDFAARPLDRLRTTLTYVFAVTFGTAQEAQLVSKVVTAVHRRVVGAGYDATDPQLQLWVAATLYDTAAQLHAMVFGSPDAATADRVYQQYAVLGTALQVPESLWPADRATFRTYWDDMIASIEVTPQARLVARDIMVPRTAPAVVRGLAPLNRLVTAGLLPPRIRSQFELPWDRRRELAFRTFMAGTRAVYPRLPLALREAPKDRYLRDMRRRVGGGRTVIGEGVPGGQ